MIYVFSDFQFDTQHHLLQRAGHAIHLRPKVFQVLTYLLAHRDRVVPREELCTRIWLAQFIGDAVVDSTIRAVRQAIGGSGRTQRFIKTFHRYGYRFIAPVTVIAAEDSGTETQRPPSRSIPSASLARNFPEALDSTSPPTPVRESTGEQKLATTLCCGVAHAPVLAKRLGTNVLYDLMQELYDIGRQEVLRYGGTMQGVMGDQLVATFGAPMAEEDHAYRAVLAALGLQQRLSERRATLRSPLREVLTVRMGLATGLVMVEGTAGTAETAAVVLGDTGAVTAVLQESAAPEVILCNDVTARLVQGLVRVEATEPAPGWATPVMAYRVLGSSSQHMPAAWTSRPFVGREQELALLQDLLAEAESGRGQVVGIMGEPGMGKSRLLCEFASRIAGRPVTYLEAYCQSYGSAIPYGPVLDLLRQFCGLADTDTSEVVAEEVNQRFQSVGMEGMAAMPYLLQLLGVKRGPPWLPELSAETIRGRTFEALRQLLLEGSRRRPLVIAVQNLHWIDRTSEDFLTLLVDSLPVAPILLLTTYRPGYLPHWIDHSYVTQVVLRPLPPHDSLSVLQAVLPGGAAPRGVVRMILAKAEGNPFFLEELARAVGEHEDRLQPLLVPDTIRQVLAARIDRLADGPKQVLQTAAILGREVDTILLSAILGNPPTLAVHLRELQRLEFLYEQIGSRRGAYVFKYGLIQEVVYESLALPRRQALHAAAGRALEALYAECLEEAYDRLAYHHAKADYAAKDVVYLGRFAAKAAQGYARRGGDHRPAGGLRPCATSACPGA
jgi:DNA-binding winged helix-turn-helix (wHTH) protein